MFAEEADHLQPFHGDALHLDPRRLFDAPADDAFVLGHESLRTLPEERAELIAREAGHGSLLAQV